MVRTFHISLKKGKIFIKYMNAVKDLYVAFLGIRSCGVYKFLINLNVISHTLCYKFNLNAFRQAQYILISNLF